MSASWLCRTYGGTGRGRVSQVTLARNRSWGDWNPAPRLPRGQQNWSGLRFFLSSSWCLPPSYGCGGCRILQARAAGCASWDLGTTGGFRSRAADRQRQLRRDRASRPSREFVQACTASPPEQSDRAYGDVFKSRVRAMGIRDRPISPGSPWQNAYVERLIGTVRRECLDRMLIFGEAHLRQILSCYAAYYNEVRTHLALGKDAPLGRAVQRTGAIVAIPILSGLHHHYVRI